MIDLCYLKYYTDNFDFRYIHNMIINNFNPIDSSLNIKYNYESSIHKQIPYTNQPVKQLDPNIIYLVLANNYSPDLGHNMSELHILLQIFETYFKDLKIGDYDYTFRILTRQDYLDNTYGKFKYFAEISGLLPYVDIADTKSFYNGNFFFIKVGNYIPNFGLKCEIRRDFFTINQKAVHMANIKYHGCSTFERIWVYRGLPANYWHSRRLKDVETADFNTFMLKNKFHKLKLPDDTLDFTHQIYLMSNCKYLFSEIGKFFINTYFMPENAHVLTIENPINRLYNDTISNITNANNIKLDIYKKTEVNLEDPDYEKAIIANHNVPYKFSDCNDFFEWFDSKLDIYTKILMNNNSKILMNNNSKTIFCDIDGTLWNHVGVVTEQLAVKSHELLPNTREAINLWDKLGYKIILTTGRKESMRKITEEHLHNLGISYDILIMGLGSGDRILINDRKLNGDKNTCYAMNVVRNKGLPIFNFETTYVTMADNQPKEVIKPWGKEELIEYNDKYVVKKLFMKAGECCSLQYHELKRETIYVVSGKLKVYIGKEISKLEEKILLPHEFINISPYTIHRMEGIEDSIYLETSTNEIMDVVRLEDKYKRENVKEIDYC